MAGRNLVLLSIPGIRTYAPLSKSGKFDFMFMNMTESQERELTEDFAKFLSLTIVVEVVNAIRRQRFPVKYKPLSKAYKERKKRKGLNEGFWIATGLLVRSIKVWRYGGVYNIGFTKDQKHKNGFSLSRILYNMEKGNKAVGIPARPLFVPILEGIGKNISNVFSNFVKTHKKYGYLYKYILK